MSNANGSWPRFVQKRLDTDYATRRVCDPFGQAERNSALSLKNKGNVGLLAPDATRKFFLSRLFAYEFGEHGPAIYLGSVHKDTLPLAKLVCQVYLCRWTLDMSAGNLNPWGMSKSHRSGSRSRRLKEPLYIGEWIEALGETQTAVARAVKMNQGYLSTIVSGQRIPSLGMIVAIADYLKIPVNKFLKPPPVVPSGDWDPELISRLGRRKN